MEQLSITNEDLMDIVDHGKESFPIQYYVDELYRYPNQMIPLHWHRDIEFYVVIGGTVQVQIGKQMVLLEEGDGIFINSNILHSFQQKNKHDECKCPNIVFSTALIASSTSVIYQKYVQHIITDYEVPYFILHKGCVWQNELLVLLDTIFSLLQRYGAIPNYYGRFPILSYQNNNITSASYEMETQNILNRIWQILYLYWDTIPRIPFEKNKQMLQIRMQKMLQYIHTHYTSMITLEDIAKSANISKSETSRCFQSYLQISPIEYVLHYRIDQAKLLLQQSAHTVVEITDMCGFQSASYFGKVFHREVGMTPLQYRNKSKDRN